MQQALACATLSAGTQGEPDPVPGLRSPTSPCWWAVRLTLRACRGTRPGHSGLAGLAHYTELVKALCLAWGVFGTYLARQGPIGSQLASLLCSPLSPWKAELAQQGSDEVTGWVLTSALCPRVRVGVGVVQGAPDARGVS